MTRRRDDIVSMDITPYYHVYSRCVRRAFLCGYDSVSKRDYEHRRQWVVDRIRLLSSIFAIDICAYAVMSNHYHMVVKLCPYQVDRLSDCEIVKRWRTLFQGPVLVQRWHKGEPLSSAEMLTVNECIIIMRRKLKSLSVFMACLNEPIAKRANKEDQCTGHFWEARFKSQALCSEHALLTCMAYSDLNPIRANMAKTPETSDYTSIKERIQPEFDLHDAVSTQQEEHDLNGFYLPLKPLAQFDGFESADMQTGIPFALEDYLELVDWTGRIVRSNKCGVIPQQMPPILKRLEINPDDWLIQSMQFEALYNTQFRERHVA